jgi:HSP20 family protein
MLLQTDPFRDFDTLFNRFPGRAATTASTMPMDAFRRGNDVWVFIDLPGVKSDDLEISVERNVLTIAARRGNRLNSVPYVNERPRGSFRRQITLGEGLDLDHLEADLHDGVLSVRIPVAEQAKPRKIAVGVRSSAPEAIEATSITK